MLLIPFYIDNVTIDGSARHSAQLMKLLFERGSVGTSPIRNINSLNQKEAVKQYFDTEVLKIKFLVVVDTWGPIWGPGKNWVHGCKIWWRHGTKGYGY